MTPNDGGARVSPAYSELVGKKVAVVGCGSAGSKIGVSLARSGGRHFVLVDDDVLLPGNLVRNEFDWRDIGGHKADALWNRIKLVNPAATGNVRRRRLSAQEASGSAAAVLSAVAGCDLIVDATADPTVFNLLSSVVVQEGKPLVWLQIFGGGYGGLVARHRPGIDADPQSMRAGVLDWCARQGESWPKGTRDYAADGEGGAPLVADDADIGVIAAHAARMALDQLCGGQFSRFPHSIYLVGLSEGWIFKDFSDSFQNMPLHGYSRLFENMLDHRNIKIMLNVGFREIEHEVRYDRLIYTGPIDEFFEYRFGRLPYRSLHFRHETLDREIFQPVAVVNHPSDEVAHTRITEYKHLTGQKHPKTSITYEYPAAEGDPYYPVPRAENAALFRRYQALADATPDVTFVGAAGHLPLLQHGPGGGPGAIDLRPDGEGPRPNTRSRSAPSRADGRAQSRRHVGRGGIGVGSPGRHASRELHWKVFSTATSWADSSAPLTGGTTGCGSI